MKDQQKVWRARGVLLVYWLGVALALFGFPRALRAQNRAYAQIVGAVTDPSGGVVPRAKVLANNVQTGVYYHTVTNGSGSYAIPYLPIGSYSVIVVASGFQKTERTGINLGVGQVAAVNVQLKVGSVNQTVTVHGNAALIDTETTARSSSFGSRTLLGLPLVGLSVENLNSLAPGTSQSQSISGGADPGRVNVSGAPVFTINANVNGGTTLLVQSVNFVAFQPALDDVQEFKMTTNNFSAQYGTGTSVMTVVTKSGTNQFHGSLFEFVQNDKFNARSFFAKGKPTQRYNQFGGTVGGPILRDRAFFFFSYQGIRNNSPANSIITVPTAAEKGGDFSAAGLPTVYDPSTGQPFPGNTIPKTSFDPVAAATLQYWPSPNLPGIVNNFYYPGGVRQHVNTFDAKVDYNLSQSNRLEWAYHNNHLDNNNLGGMPGPACVPNVYCGLQVSHSMQNILSDTWTITPQMVNALHFNFIRQYNPITTFNYNQNFPSKLGLKNVPPYYFPQFQMTGAIPTALGPGNHGKLVQNVYQTSDNVNRLVGRHVLDFGGDFTKYQLNTGPTWNSGTFNFTGLFTQGAGSRGIGFADFLLGLPQTYSLVANPTDLGGRRWSIDAYLQDEYKLTRRLSLDLGIRYEAQSAFYEAHNRLENFDPGLTNPLTNTPGALLYATSGNRMLQDSHNALFAPRAGFAWQPMQDTSVRAAYGIFYIQPSGARQFNAGSPGYSINESVFTTSASSPPFTLTQGPPTYALPNPANITPAISNNQSINYWPRNWGQAYVQQWQLSIQRQLGASMVVEAAYVGSKGTHLLFPRDLNQIPADLLGPGTTAQQQAKRPYPQYLGMNTFFSDGNSSFNSLQLSINRRASHGLDFMANYTWSKSIDNCSEDISGDPEGCPFQQTYRPDLNRGVSEFDVPQRVNATVVYQLPFKTNNRLLNGVVEGWQGSSIFSANSGIPLTVFVGGANLSDSLAGSWYPNLIGNPALPSGQRTTQQWFNTSAFATPAPFTFGNEGRNIVRGPGFWDLDFALAKSFKIGETKSLQIRMDSFNFFNHPNLFIQPDYGSAEVLTGSKAFGTVTNSTGGRTIQLGARLTF